MQNYYWNNWYTGWGWFLWYGVFLLFFLSVGNWGYTYKAHRRFGDGYPNKDALDILNERYARGDLKHEEYIKMKSHIAGEVKESMSDQTQDKSPRRSDTSLRPTY